MTRLQLNLAVVILFGLNVIAGANDRTKILVTSSLDGSAQPSYLIIPEHPADGLPRPLLVSLHSWSSDLEQREEGLERLAAERGWFYLFPNFRGKNDHPEACGSRLAQQDILDAVAWVQRHHDIDDNRIYLTGVSGGGHMTMLMAAMHPDVWAAASAWVGISDLERWHAKHRGTKYGDMLEAVCGGPPGHDPQVDKQYRERSPKLFLHRAARLPVDIAAGVHDGHQGSVPIRHSLEAFNAIARQVGADEISEREMDQLSRPNGRLERPRISDQVVDKTLGRRIYLRRRAGHSRVTIFEGGHERIDVAAIEWLERFRKDCSPHAVSLVSSLKIGVDAPVEFRRDNPPEDFVFDERLGLLRPTSMTGMVIHVAADGMRGLFETRAVRTPQGDLLLMFPEGNHYAAGGGKVNDMIAYRSSDDGQSWRGPKLAFKIDYSQHGFIPLIPRNTHRIYAFGTQPIPTEYSRAKGRHENAPIGFRWSDDDGVTWSDVTLIRPQNDPNFLGMSVTRMCETETGAWLLGSHTADWSKNPLQTRQYLLRSVDRGKTWTLLPDRRPNGWFTPRFLRMDEGRPIFVGGHEIYFMARTPTGRIWTARSQDDGKTWTSPKPSTLVHPDAPPMVFHLSDGETLITFIHNRHIKSQYTGLSGNMDGMQDRNEVWVAFSTDQGRTWSEPRFLFANATNPNPQKSGWFNYNVSYLDAVIDRGTIHLFCPHLWNRALHLVVHEKDLEGLPTKAELTDQ